MRFPPEALLSPPRPHVWSLVVPVKALSDAKSRLTAGVERRRLALAFAVDTVRAAKLCPAVSTVVVVTDDDEVARAVAPLGAIAISDPTPGELNAALRHGADFAATLTTSSTAVAALPADLPALLPKDLEEALVEASAYAMSFLADAVSSGTTLYAAASPRYFQPAYGVGSARRHRAQGAHELLVPVPTLRRDVDTAEDLLAARRLGLGPATSRVLAGKTPVAASTGADEACG